MRKITLLALAVLTGIAGVVLAEGAKDQPPKQRSFDTKYYVIRTDVDNDTAREAAVRLTAMAEEYMARTRGFSNGIQGRMQFILCADAESYYKAGGMPGSAGLFNGKALMAFMQGDDGETWHVLQHEGFHQFAYACIGRGLPMWVNEGLAEYFGQSSLWTGDVFVSGVIPPGRLKRVQAELKDDKFMPFASFLELSNRDWNAHLTITNYDQAWTMMYYLIHARNGRFCTAAGTWIKDIAAGQDWKQAWFNRLGRDLAGFEKDYKEYWLSLKPNATEDTYHQVTVHSLCSFMGRAIAKGQKFQTAEEFFTAAREDKLKKDDNRWLPPSLLKNALQAAPAEGKWSLEFKGIQARLVLTDEQHRFVGWYNPTTGRTDVTVEPLKKADSASQPNGGTSKPASNPAGH